MSGGLSPNNSTTGSGSAVFTGRDIPIKIAWEAAEKRRVAEEELANKQLRWDGTVAPCRGYAVYSDFDKYMEQEIAEGRLKPTRGGRYHHHIKEVLERPGHPTRPLASGTRSTELPRFSLARTGTGVLGHVAVNASGGVWMPDSPGRGLVGVKGVNDGR